MPAALAATGAAVLCGRMFVMASTRATRTVPVFAALFSLALCGGACGDEPPGALSPAGETSPAVEDGEAVHEMAGSRCQTGPRRLRTQE